jgi:hypothetical protein
MGTLIDVYPEFKTKAEGEIIGFALKNLYGRLLEKLKEDRYRYDGDQWFLFSLGFLLKGIDINIQMNKVDISAFVE